MLWGSRTTDRPDQPIVLGNRAVLPQGNVLKIPPVLHGVARMTPVRWRLSLRLATAAPCGRRILAVGKTVIFAGVPSPFSRRFNSDVDGASAE